MAKFEHRFAALTLQDDKGVWAQFTPASRVARDGREEQFGVLDTSDAATVKRLQAMAKKDPDLTEVKSDEVKSDEPK